MTQGTAVSRGRVRSVLLLAPLLLAVLGAYAWSAPAARADTLASDFSVAGGRQWVRSPLVTVGDRGRTPFTRPGVIAWDGGSVMGSFGIDVHKMFAQKTQALLGRPAALYVSATPGADVADMIAEAPAEVDTHFDPASDANVCVVQGGASDLKDGPEVVGAVFDALKAYCAGRRAAGFQVAVLTLLPRSDIPHFNEARNSFNALVREQWPDFADALVDVAADPRIGDDGDNEDRIYYRRDQVHPNASGCAVLAQDTAPVLDTLAWQADSLSWRFRNEQGTWSAWAPYTYAAGWSLGPGEGRRTVLCEYRSATGQTDTVADAVGLDTVQPTVRTYGERTLSAGSPVRLTLRVDDTRPCARTASVTVDLLRGHRVVRSVVRPKLSVRTRHVLALGRGLPRGLYTWRVRARDRAGNPQAAVCRGVLRIQ